MLHFALSNQISDSTGNLFNRHFRVYPMLIQQVDRFDLKTLERAFHACLDEVRTTVKAAIPGAVCVRAEAELCRNDDVVPHGRESFPNDFLVREGAIDLGSVEESDPALDRSA